MIQLRGRFGPFVPGPQTWLQRPFWPKRKIAVNRSKMIFFEILIHFWHEKHIINQPPWSF